MEAEFERSNPTQTGRVLASGALLGRDAAHRDALQRNARIARECDAR